MKINNTTGWGNIRMNRTHCTPQQVIELFLSLHLCDGVANNTTYLSFLFVQTSYDKSNMNKNIHIPITQQFKHKE